MIEWVRRIYMLLKTNKSLVVRTEAARFLANAKVPDITGAIKESLKSDGDSGVRVASVCPGCK